LNSTNSFTANSQCIDIQILEDKSVVAATVEGGIKVIKGALSKDYRIQNIAGGKYGSFRSFEKDGVMLFAFLSDGGKKLTIYDFVNKVQIASHASESPILYIEVDFSGELILFFTNDCKLHIFDINSKSVSSKMAVEADFEIYKIVFNYDLSKIALIGKNGQLYICTPSTLKVVGLSVSVSGESCFNGFLDEKNFVSVSKDGLVSIIDTDTMKTARNNIRFPSFCKKGFFLNENRLFLGIFRDAGFAVFDIESEKNIASGRLATPHEPFVVRLDEKNLFLVVEDSKETISTYDIGALFAVFKDFFSKKDFTACYTMVFENELLALTNASKMLEDAFAAFSMSALKMAESENYEGAIKQLTPFVKVAQKKGELKEVLESIETMRIFVGFIRARKFSNAYNLADKHRFLKLTAYFKGMEDEWHNKVEQAKTLAIAGRVEEAKECFAAFRGVASKTELIKKLLTERETINLFLKKLAAKDFKSAFELANLHPVLQEIKEFKTLKELGEKGIQKALLLLKTGEMQKALDAINALKVIPIFKSEAEGLELRAVVYQKYYNYQKSGDKIKARILEKKYPFLTESNSCPL